MKMQMFAYAGPSRLTEVETDIDAVRSKRALQDIGAVSQKIHHFKRLFLGQVADIHQVAKGGDHEVPVVVGIFVHNDEAALAAMQHQPLFVLGGALGQAEHAGVGFGAEYVFNPPGTPELFHYTPRGKGVVEAPIR